MDGPAGAFGCPFCAGIVPGVVPWVVTGHLVRLLFWVIMGSTYFCLSFHLGDAVIREIGPFLAIPIIDIDVL